MIEITYVGSQAGGMYRSYVFPRNEAVAVPEDIAMRFADSADFEIGDPVEEDSSHSNNKGEEE